MHCSLGVCQSGEPIHALPQKEIDGCKARGVFAHGLVLQRLAGRSKAEQESALADKLHPVRIAFGNQSEPAKLLEQIYATPTAELLDFAGDFSAQCIVSLAKGNVDHARAKQCFTENYQPFMLQFLGPSDARPAGPLIRADAANEKYQACIKGLI